MYYYIMEPATKKTTVWQDKVKDILGNIGIAGETVTPSPARTIEELTALGVAKGYSTIVAVGSEEIVNKVINCVINQKDAKDAVLGIIPENYQSVLAQKIRVKDLRDACETLKYRKLETLDACFVEPNKYFLTEAVIEPPKPTDAYLITPEIKAGLLLSKMIIRPGLEIEVHDATATGQQKKIFNWLFGKQETNHGYSLFHSKYAKVEVLNGGAKVTVENEIIAKTPIVCHNKPKALKIITSRDTIIEKA